MEEQISALIGDIGGTNVRLRIFKISKSQRDYDALIPIKSQEYQTDKFPAFIDFLQDFLANITDYPKLAVIGIAGPINNNSTSMANTKWPPIDGNAISDQLKIQPFVLINDFKAVAYGILGLKKSDLIVLRAPEKCEQNNVITVCGPGTGLGVSSLYPAKIHGGVQYQVASSEGGHTSFSPNTELEQKYLQFVKRYLKDEHICVERAMAGRAIPFIYKFLRETFPEIQSVVEDKIGQEKFNVNLEAMRENDLLKDFPSKAIFKFGINQECPLSEKVIQMFISLYSTVVGNIICRTLPYSGMYLFGSISEALSSYILSHPQLFLQDFMNSRPYMKRTFDRIPIYIIKKVDLGLEGAFQAALRVLESEDQDPLEVI